MFKNWFKKLKQNNFLGLDIGTSSIKIVELSYRGGRCFLVNYGWADVSGFQLQQSDSARFFSAKNEIRDITEKLLKKMHPKSKSVYVSIAGYNGLLALVDMPNVKDEDLEESVKFEAVKYIPSSLDEVFISWDVVFRQPLESDILEDINLKNDEQKKAENTMEILLAAVPKQEVFKMENIVKNLGLEVEAMELENFSLARSLVKNDLGTFIIVDIGSRLVNVILVQKGVIKASRSLNTGGYEITSAIAEGMKISKTKAESMKKQKGDFFLSSESLIVIPTLEMIIEEVKRMINIFKAKNAGASINSIILSGGGIKMKGLDRFLSNSLGLRVEVVDPFSGIQYDESLSPYIKEIGPSFAVAVGLALRGVEEYQRK